MLLSAHEMNALLPVMDRIVYIAGGRAASGSTDEVVRPDVLSPCTAITSTCSTCTAGSSSWPARASRRTPRSQPTLRTRSS